MSENHELGRLQEAVSGLSAVASKAQTELEQWRRDDRIWREKIAKAVAQLDKQLSERRIRGDYCERRFKALEEKTERLEEQREGVAWKVLGAVAALIMAVIQAWIILSLKK